MNDFGQKMPFNDFFVKFSDILVKIAEPINC